MITHNITLHIKDQNAVDTGIAVSQGDYGRVKFVIYVKDGETYLSGAETAELAFTTPNGYIVTGNVTIETGAYSYIFQGNELQAAGKVSAVLTLTFSDGRVSTCGFLFVCRYNPMYDRNMDAGPYLGEIETLKSAAQFALEDARGAAAVAEAAKEAAVSAANNAEAVSGVGIATSQKAGLVKPDGSTTSVDAEGILSIILKDTHGILGTENATVMMQALIDAIADKVVNQVLTKAMLINNGLTTESGKYPLDAAYGKTLLDLYTKLNSEVGEIAFMPSTYIDDPNGFFNVTGWATKMHISLLSISGVGWAVVVGVYDHNNGTPKARQLAVGTTRTAERSLSAGTWSSWE